MTDPIDAEAARLLRNADGLEAEARRLLAEGMKLLRQAKIARGECLYCPKRAAPYRACPGCRKKIAARQRLRQTA